MKVIHTTFGSLLVAGLLAFSSCEPQAPVQLPEIPLATVTPYFSEAAEVQAIDTSFYQVKDAEGNLLGTMLYSMPYTATVNGYNGPTPLLIALDAKNCIKNVVLLENRETPRFVQIAAEGGLFQEWDGLNVEEAISKPVDAVTGATFTSNGVKSSLILRLQAYQRQLKEYRTPVEPKFWQKLFTYKIR